MKISADGLTSACSINTAMMGIGEKISSPSLESFKYRFLSRLTRTQYCPMMAAAGRRRQRVGDVAADDALYGSSSCGLRVRDQAFVAQKNLIIFGCDYRP